MAADDIGAATRLSHGPGTISDGFVPAHACAAAAPATLSQIIALAGFGLAGLALAAWDAAFAGRLVRDTMFAAFALVIALRLGAALTARPQAPWRPLPEAQLATYSIIAPLYREAAVAEQLIQALCALDYPRDRLEAIIVVEADDPDTLAALAMAAPPAWIRVIVAEPGAPKTKPRACNIALAYARGELVVVYDAEDRPDPQQLREAAARFAVAPAELACLQAPLRIDGAESFTARQFALEYAAQFEVMTPAMVRLGAAFPLGGTSNHFRARTLRAVGAWDPYNVTEDADLGFRLAARGLTCGMLNAPTWESAPDSLADWLPQRTRWVKGYMQTWGVHMRRPLAGGWRALASL